MRSSSFRLTFKSFAGPIDGQVHRATRLSERRLNFVESEIAGGVTVDRCDDVALL